MMKPKGTGKDILRQIQTGDVTVQQGAQLLKEMMKNRQARIHGYTNNKQGIQAEKIAIIGMSGRFPGAANINEFWKNLANGVDSVSEIPPHRWNKETYFHPNPGEPNKTYCNYGGFLDEIDRFDPWFFNISPREAELMDPQQRLFLQEAWKTLEDAGYPSHTLANKKCGVFVGCSPGDYQELFQKHDIPPQSYTFMGNALSILPSRISYFLDLKGPSISIDTACSSSLTAIYLACESILQGTSEMALAGGVALQITPKFHILAGSTQMLSATGKCKAFDDSADGFVPGEGVGVVLLKPYSAALRDNDHIYAVITAMGLNQDGKTNGITAPSATSQTALECETYNTYTIDPATIGYIETHGTATKLGDPIEIQALTDAFKKYTTKKQYCAIGSVKSNIGHALAAAGVASIIKVLLSFKHKQLPPSLHYKTPNRHINFDESPFYVNTELIPWHGIDQHPRRSAVSSFGFSGTNAHFILEEPPAHPKKIASLETAPTTSNPSYFFIPFSVKSNTTLEEKYKNLSDWLRDNPNEDIANISYTLLTGRTHFPVRSALVVKDNLHLQNSLQTLIKTGHAPNLVKSSLTNETTHSLNWDLFSPSLSETNQIASEKSKQIIERLLTDPPPSPGETQELVLELAKLYVKGQAEIPEWSKLFRQNNGREIHRISLPAYPFEKGRFWLPETGSNTQETFSATENETRGCTPSFSGNEDEKIIFKKRYTGKEFFLEDHIHTLPAVVYLEMVRAAGDQINVFSKVRKFRKVVWPNPLKVTDNATEVEIRLYTGSKKDWVEFQVITHRDRQKDIKEKLPLVHSWGTFKYKWTTPGENPHPTDTEPQVIQQLDIEGIIKRSQGGKQEALTFYQRLENNKSFLGHRFKSLKELYYNDNEALAFVGIPQELEKDMNQFKLHPTLTDSALQCMAAFGYATGNRKDRVYVPYVLGEMEIVETNQNSETKDDRICYAYVRPSTMTPPNEDTSDDKKTYDALLLNQKGDIKIRFKAFTFRPYAKSEKLQTNTHQYIYYINTWDKSVSQLPQAKPENGVNTNLLVFDTQTGIMESTGSEHNSITLVTPGKQYRCKTGNHYEINPTNSNDYEKLLEALEEHNGTPHKILYLWSTEPFSTGKQQLNMQMQRGINSVILLSKALLKKKKSDISQSEILVFFNSGNEEVHPLHAAIIGLARTVALESNSLSFRTISIENHIKSGNHETQSAMRDIILHEIQNTGNSEVMYREGIRYQRSIIEIQPGKENNNSGEHQHQQEQPILLKEKGVYLITGGTGALGMIIAQNLAQRVKARLVLTDLNEINATDQQQLDRLKQLGAEVLFVKADISNRKQVELLFKEIKDRYGDLNGIIHTAGITRDAFLEKKDIPDIQAVIAPKVLGTILLDEISTEEPLEFFVLYSSLTAILGSPGQSDYGYANSFMDHYAQYRESLFKSGKRPGKTLSINWPYWKNGGMKLDQRIEALMANEKGILPLEDKAGIEIFETLLSQPHSHIGVVVGNREKILSTLNIKPTIQDNTKAQNRLNAQTSNPQMLQQEPEESQEENQFPEEILEMVSGLLKIPRQRLSLQGNISNYGFDSISFTELAVELNKKYQLGVTPDVFFEHTSLGSISQFLLERYRDKLIPEKPKQNIPPEETAAEVNSSTEKDTNQMNGYFSYEAEDMFADEIEDEEDDQAIGIGNYIETLQGKQQENEPVAIIGMSGILPQSNDLDEFWNKISQGKLLVSEIPSNRWDWRAFSDQTQVKWGAFMKEAGNFDSLFFNISPREAELMDPQLRLFLETVWHTLEDAGYKSTQLEGTDTAVFVGVSTMDYKRVLDRIQKLGSEQLPFMVANRVSYFFDWHGPSEAVDTACSSSLVAIHRAVEALQKGTSQLAIAGGVSVIADPYLFINEANSGMLSPEGRCYTFDKRANGYVRGEGVGAILLKPLKKAKADNDYIYGIIRGTAVNHSGHTNSPTTPNPASQAEVILNAIEKSGIAPEAISYIEAHGTATSLGDPIEINGLKKAFEQLYKNKNQPVPENKYCAIGTVKTNTGHLEAAAGITGVINVLLAMKHSTLIGNANFAEINPYINLENSPFYILKDTQTWNPPLEAKGKSYPRYAGVSSFGIGGTNAHVILEEGNPNQTTEKQHPLQTVNTIESMKEESPRQQNRLFILSARNEERLKHYALKFAQYLKNATETNTLPTLEEITYTLQVGRESMDVRLAIIAPTPEEIRSKLTQFSWTEGEPDIDNLYTGNTKKQKSWISVEDEEGETYLRLIVQKGKLHKIAQLWVSGAEIDWSLLYKNRKLQRQPLPQYPFAEKRHWISWSPDSEPMGIQSVPSDNIQYQQKEPVFDLNTELKDFLYVPVWKPIEQSEMVTEKPREETNPSEEQKIILVISPSISSEATIPETIKSTIKSHHKNDHIFHISIGTKTRKLKKNEWESDTTNPESWKTIINQFKSLDLLYFFGITPHSNENQNEENNDNLLPLFRLIKAINHYEMNRKPLGIKIITNNVYEVKPSQVITPYSAPLHGIARVLSRENPHYAIQSIDIGSLEAQPGETEKSDLSRAIQMQLPSNGYQEIAIRENSYYTQKIEPLLLPEPQPSIIKANAVYWIIGGAGKIGMEICQYLTANFNARIVLSGRSQLRSDIQQKLSQIEATGGTATYLPVDITNPESTKQTLIKIKETFGQIDGVIHAAVDVNNKALENMEEEMFIAGLAPKIKGSINLYQALANEKLQFLVFFSSVQSFLGEPGMSNYVAANAFQDAYARYLSQKLTYPVKSINWGYWGIQSTVVNPVASRSVVQHGLKPFAPVLGIEALLRILESKWPQVIPLKAEHHLLQKLGLSEKHLETLKLHEKIKSHLSTEAPIMPLLDPAKQPQLEKQIWLNLAEAHDQLEHYSRFVLLDIFQQMGVFRSPGEQYKFETLRKQLKVIPEYFRLLDVLLEIVENNGYITDTHGNTNQRMIETTNKLESPETKENLSRLPQEKDRLLSTYPDIKASVHLLWTVYQKYPSILNGSLPAAEVMFPGSSMELMEGLYKGNLEADYYNRLVIFAFKSYMESKLPVLPKDQRITLLEIGAGTGGTSAPLFKAINLNGYADKIQYIYTDISHAFARHGKDRYGQENPYAVFKVLDIEKDVKKQGYTPGSIDLIVATNVLHATRLMRNTLTNVKTLLKPGGWIILNEGTKNRDYGSVMFGLLEGWWLYQDEENRLPGCPMLTTETWSRILREQGFQQVTIIGQPGVGSMTGMQHIITGRMENTGNSEYSQHGQQSSVNKAARESTVALAHTEVTQRLKTATEKSGLPQDQQVEETIIKTLAKVLQMETSEFDIETPYTDFGVDSILAIEIVNHINQQLGIQLRSTDLFNYTSIKKLTAYIIKEFSDTLTIQEPDETPAITPAPTQVISSPPPPTETDDQTVYYPASIPNEKSPDISKMEIAIIGLSGRFPDAQNVDELWENIKAGRNSVREITRWEEETFFDPDPKVSDKSYCKWAGLLSEIDTFDPLFFNISPKEAELMDPQQRLFLEESWKALEDAGYSDRSLDEKKCGVFVGFNASDYKKIIEQSGMLPDAYIMTGNYEAMLSARISYFLNLRGPAITVNTACSASLTAVHLACESITSGTSEMAIAGGVGIMNTPEIYIMLSRTEVLSATGQCRAFNNAADGIAMGEGVGAVVLKRLDRALADGDHIYGVIIGSGLNQDGRSNGITAPNGPSQTALECEVYDKYHIRPEDISYIETHGTGTRLGDPLELDALTDAFKKYTPKKQFCAIGSIKSNIGHLGAAAGVTGLIKMALSLKHKKIAPSLFTEEPNALIDFKNSPFYLNNTLKDWTNHEKPRLGAVSSFGFSGTNSHIVVKEFDNQSTIGNLPKTDHRENMKPYYLLPISAKTMHALNEKIENLTDWLDNKGQQQQLNQISYTLLEGRSHFSIRSVFIVESSNETTGLATRLRNNVIGQTNESYWDNTHIPTNQRNKPKLDPTLQKLGEKTIRELGSNELSAKEYKEKLQIVAELYIKGYNLNWNEIYNGEKCQRLSMPTYPFARERYWVPLPVPVPETLTENQQMELENIMQQLENGEITLQEAEGFLEEKQ